MLQWKNLGAQSEWCKVLFIGNDSPANHAVCGFLRTLGCTCTVAPSSEALTRIEHELFDVVLLDVIYSQLPHEQTILAIKKVRPTLAERILLITGSRPGEGSVLGNLPHISLEKPLSQIWTKLEEILAVPQLSRLAPPGMQNARLTFDSFSSPVWISLAGQILDQHEQDPWFSSAPEQSKRNTCGDYHKSIRRIRAGD